jgi:hypothetical protein
MPGYPAGAEGPRRAIRLKPKFSQGLQPRKPTPSRISSDKIVEQPDEKQKQKKRSRN